MKELKELNKVLIIIQIMTILPIKEISQNFLPNLGSNKSKMELQQDINQS
jgi:hypothetical protein